MFNQLRNCYEDNRGTCMIGTECKNGRCRRDTETGKVAGRPCKTGRCALGLRCQDDFCIMTTCIPTGEEYKVCMGWSFAWFLYLDCFSAMTSLESLVSAAVGPSRTVGLSVFVDE